MKLIDFGGIRFTNKTPFEIEDLLNEFKDEWLLTLLPTYKLASEFFTSKYVFRDETAKMYNDFIVTAAGLDKKQNTFAQVIYMLVSKFDINQFFAKFRERFKNGIDVYSLSVADAAIVNQLIGLQFFAKYSTLMLHYISILESNTYPENSALASYTLPEQQRAWIDRQSDNYRKEINVIGSNVKRLFAELDRVPTTFVSDLANSKSGFTGSNPNGFDSEDIKNLWKYVGIATGIIAGVGLIAQTIYWRMSGGAALYIAKNIQKQKQLKTALELRLFHLRNLQENTPSASVEKNIQITEDRLRKIEKELFDMEKKYDK